jgi:cysteine desulfurase/selenocysteine lyase
MSTNINLPHSDNGISGLPDVHEIEQLANELFKLLPNEVPQANFSPDLADHPRLQKSLNLVHERLPSLFGKEHGPSEDHLQPFDVNNPQTSLSDPHFPASPTAAGSGVSPSVVRHGPGYASSFPLSADTSFEPDVSKLWSTINTFKSAPQLPSNGGLESAQYYFLSGAGFQGNDPFGHNPLLNSQLTNHTFPHFGGASSHSFFDVNLVRRDFPIFLESVNGKPLIWFDNAATTQKPQSVIDRVSYFYQHENSNIHRAAHELAARATDAYEAAREKCRTFLNARSVNEIIFVRGATEAINLVAKTWGDENLQAGDEIILSNLEHHANIVPWQQLACKKGFKIRVIPVDDDGQILLSEYAKLLNHRTRLVSFTQVSNALGTVTPAKQMVEMAHSVGAKVLVDGAQSVSHLRTDVQALNADWFVFSGHKVFGPTGIGVLYGKEDLLNDTQTWQGGGNMIEDVTFEHTRFHKAPNRFEAGTGNIADAVGLGAAIDYVNKIGIDAIHQYEDYLLKYATGLLKNIPGLRQIGTAPDKASVLSFVFEGYKTEEVGAAPNKEGIAVRSGHHCAQPILRRFGVETTVRPSLAFYNTTSEIDVLIETLYRLRKAKK